MHGGLRGECPIWPEQPVVPLIKFCPAREWIARMQIKRDVERLDDTPERTVLRKIIIGDVFGRSDLRKSIDQGSDHAEVFDAARELGRCRLGVLHRKCCESRKA